MFSCKRLFVVLIAVLLLAGCATQKQHNDLLTRIEGLEGTPKTAEEVMDAMERGEDWIVDYSL